MGIEAVILVAAFVLMLIMETPVAFAIGAAAYLAITALGTVPAEYQVAERIVSGIDSFTLLAIPFFILAGVLMGEGGMARRLMSLADALLGWLTGGMAYVNTLTCMMFGAISGSATAAVTSVGGFMIPEMNRAGYPKDFNVALTTTSATTGLIIPPSNIMIVYAVVAQSSIAALFFAGILPGIVFGLFIMACCLIISKRHNFGNRSKLQFDRMFKEGLRAVPSLGLIVIVLGGILSGKFTATEASAIAVAYAYLLGVIIYREISHRRLPRLLLQAGKTTAIVMLLIGASQAMSWFLAYQQIPQAFSSYLLGLTENKYALLLIMNCILLVVGTFLDMTPAVLIFTPIFLPIAAKLGMDPVHFGIMLIANLCIGLCTPPVGTCLFVGCSVGNTTISRVTAKMLPFYAAMVASLLLITYVPQLSLFLPRLLGI